jgi:hypothetical protein
MCSFYLRRRATARISEEAPGRKAVVAVADAADKSADRFGSDCRILLINATHRLHESWQAPFSEHFIRTESEESSVSVALQAGFTMLEIKDAKREGRQPSLVNAWALLL